MLSGLFVHEGFFYESLTGHNVVTALSNRTVRPYIFTMSSLFGLSPECPQLVIKWPSRTYSFCSPGCSTDVSLPSALGWPSAMYATAACDHSEVVLLGGCRISLGLYRFPPTVPATSQHRLLQAYTGEAGMLKRNCCESVGGYSRAGGDGGCVAGL